MSDTIRVAIAEDSAVLRDGLVQLLADRGFVITDAVGAADELEEAVERDCPDVAVIDIRMPPTFTDEGLRAAIGLRERYPKLGILLFSQYVETRYAAQLLARDAAGIGYLLKDRVADTSDFVEALVRVASGGTALDPEVVTQMVGASRQAGVASWAQRAGAAGALAHGGGPLECRDRECARDLGGSSRKARGQHLHQARPAGVAGAPPTRARGAAVPRVVEP